MDPDLELRQLRAFVAIVEHGGVTKAARALGVSQSTASEAIAALERALGASVFVRGRRAPTLTTAGETLLPHARAVLASVRAAVGGIAEVVEGARGTLAIGANESVSAYLLPPATTAVRGRLPNVRIDVGTGVCSAVREGVRAGRWDVGLVVEPAEVPGIDATAEDARAIATTRLVAFTHPAHARARRRTGPGEAWAMPWFLSDTAGSFTWLLRRWLKDAGFPTDRLTGVGSVEGLKRSLHADTSAVGLLPLYAIADELARGDVAELPLAPALPPVQLKAIVAGRESAAVRALVEALREATSPA